MKRFYVLLLLQFFGVFAFANLSDFGGFSIGGRIADSNGNPLVGATVVVDNTLLGVSSGKDGSFVINRLKSGNYTLVVSYMGYDTKKVDVTVNDNVYVNIILNESSLMCEEVVVSATRASTRMPIAQSTMDKEMVRASNTGFDVPYLLEMLPSVVATSEGGTGIGNTTLRIRGTDHTRINVTINGIPLNDAESQGVYWVDLPDFASSVDNVQVQRGVGTSTNGAAAFGATVNFQTVTLNPEPFAAVDLFAGSYNTQKISGRVGTGLVNSKFSFEGRYSQLQSDGYIERAGSDHKSMFFTGAWHGTKNLVRFNIIHGEEHTNIMWNGTPSYMLKTNRRFNPAGLYTDENGITQHYEDEKDNYWQTHYHLISSHALTENLTLNATLHLTDGKGYYEEFKEDRKFSKYGLSNIVIGTQTFSEADFIQRKWMDNVFYGVISSLNYSKGSVDATLGGAWNKHDGDHFGRIMWSSVNAGLPKNYEWYTNNGLKKDWNLFAKSTWQVNDIVSIFADVQYRGVSYKLKGFDSDIAGIDQNHNWKFFNPKTGAVIKFLSSHEVYYSFGIANREPARSDLKDGQKYGDDYIPKPERLYDWELGYKFKHQKFAFNANFYYMIYKDQLVLTGELTDVGYAKMDNVPNSYRAGIELIFGMKPLDWLKIDLNSTLSKNIIEDYTHYTDLYDNSNDWNQLPQEAEKIGNSTISFSPSVVSAGQITVIPFKNLSFALISKYVGSQFIDNSENEERKLDAYWVNNFKADYVYKLKGTKSVYLQFMVNNLFNADYISNAWIYRAKFANGDADYIEDGYFSQATRNFSLKLGVEF